MRTYQHNIIPCRWDAPSMLKMGAFQTSVAIESHLPITGARNTILFGTLSKLLEQFPLDLLSPFIRKELHNCVLIRRHCHVSELNLTVDEKLLNGYQQAKPR
jgi:hypothetical protein